MALQAKVKESYTYYRATACGGHEFVKGQWRPVPEEREKEAKATKFLEVRKAVSVEDLPKPSKEILKLAEKERIDLASVIGTGAKGAILMKDLKKAIADKSKNG